MEKINEAAMCRCVFMVFPGMEIMERAQKVFRFSNILFQLPPKFSVQVHELYNYLLDSSDRSSIK